MKNTEMESLRAEMRELRQDIADLESRLCEVEPEADPWAIWPYSWAIDGWQKTRECFHSFQLNTARRVLERHEARLGEGVTSGDAGEGNELCEMRALRLM